MDKESVQQAHSLTEARPPSTLCGAVVRPAAGSSCREAGDRKGHRGDADGLRCRAAGGTSCLHPCRHGRSCVAAIQSFPASLLPLSSLSVAPASLSSPHTSRDSPPNQPAGSTPASWTPPSKWGLQSVPPSCRTLPPSALPLPARCAHPYPRVNSCRSATTASGTRT